jgi:class 3 adenylate cyclase
MTIADLMQQARDAEYRGQFDRARSLLRQATQDETPSLLVDALLRLGKLLVQGGLPCDAEAQSVLDRARARAEADGSPRQAAKALHLLALLERQRGRLDQAQELLDQSGALKLAESPGSEAGQLFHYRGLLLADRNALDQAERLYFRALALYHELHHEPGQAEVFDSLANLMLRRGKGRHALAFARRSLELKRTFGDRYGEAISQGTIGRAHLQHGQYEEARQAFAEDLKLAAELNDQNGVGVMHNHLGEVALLRREPDIACVHFEENLRTERGPLSTFYARLGLARAHLAVGRLDAASAQVENAMPLVDLLARRPGLAEMVQGLQGVVAWQQGDPAGGESRIVQAIESLRRSQLFTQTVPFLYDLRDLYYQQKDTARAVSVMARALEVLSEYGSEAGVVEIEKWLRTVDSPALVRLALERHFPDYLVESILTGHLSQNATRRQQVSVLFCDLRGFTTLAEKMSPEEVVEMLNEWFAEATRAIQAHGGVVDKFIGDAVMALFGVPESRPDAAADAVRAALALRDALSALNQRHLALEPRREPLRIGVGIDTGDAVVGFIGSHLRQSYTAIGDTVNTASRLESATKQYSECDILISARTQEGQERYKVAETELGRDEELKGKSEKVRVYLVRGRRDVPAAEG